ncbi:MAG: hypothetical protein V2I97_09920 [Desulfococcaceae bacterium]|nr:hypothetical protein [Desulfococcaceae bacterium]
MGIFKEDKESKRMIFNVRMDLAERLEKAKNNARKLGKKLDADSAVDEALEKFLKKAEKKIIEKMKKSGLTVLPYDPPEDTDGEESNDPDTVSVVGQIR